MPPIPPRPSRPPKGGFPPQGYPPPPRPMHQQGANWNSGVVQFNHFYQPQQHVAQGTSDMPPQGVDPDTYARQYANAKGITLDEAKAELKAKYGDPQKNNAPQTLSANQAATTTEQPKVSENNYSLTSTDAKKNAKYLVLENKIETKFAKKGKINPSVNAIFDNSYRITHKWIKSYMKEHNVTFEEAQQAFCERFNCTLSKDSYGYAFFAN